MSTIEVRVQTNNKWRMALVPLALLAMFYYHFGYLPFALWVGGAALLIVLPFSLLRNQSADPCIVLNDQGVFDRRLKVGVIRWTDIRRAYRYSLHGAQYVCLDLHDMKTYEARRPSWLRLLTSVQRIFGMSPIAIGSGGLDMDSGILLNKIQEGCQMAHRK